VSLAWKVPKKTAGREPRWVPVLEWVPESAMVPVSEKAEVEFLVQGLQGWDFPALSAPPVPPAWRDR
jgi:hypothetical protein